MNQNTPVNITTGCPVSPISEVNREMDDLANGIKRIDAASCQIYSRLNAVLRPTLSSNGTGKDQVPEAMLCPHASEIREKSKSLHAIAANLEELLCRIEI